MLNGSVAVSKATVKLYVLAVVGVPLIVQVGPEPLEQPDNPVGSDPVVILKVLVPQFDAVRVCE